jgi:DNA-binding XRE family transcriptional regulator
MNPALAEVKYSGGGVCRVTYRWTVLAIPLSPERPIEGTLFGCRYLLSTGRFVGNSIPLGGGRQMIQALDGEKLRDERLSRGLTQEQMADLLSKAVGHNVRQSTYSNWERDRHHPNGLYSLALVRIWDEIPPMDDGGISIAATPPYLRGLVTSPLTDALAA